MATVRLNRAQIQKIAKTGFDDAAKRVTSEAQKVAQRISPRETGEYRASFRARRCSSTLWTFGNEADHAIYLEKGVRPFVYRNGGQVIKFRPSSGNGYRFLRRHPGSKPQNILRRSVAQAIRKLLK